MSAHSRIISRDDARVLGLKRYFTGEPCKYGHVAERFITAACVECSRARHAPAPRQTITCGSCGIEVRRARSGQRFCSRFCKEAARGLDAARQTLRERQRARRASDPAMRERERVGSRERAVGLRAKNKAEALAFAHKLLAGKYPHLIPADHAPYILYTAVNREILKDSGRPLYIGISNDWVKRRKEHAATAKGRHWLNSADYVHLDIYPNRTLARAAEAVAISEKRPLFNDQHNADKDMRALR